MTAGVGVAHPNLQTAQLGDQTVEQAMLMMIMASALHALWVVPHRAVFLAVQFHLGQLVVVGRTRPLWARNRFVVDDI